MPRGDQVARLYTLVQELAASRHGLPVETLAERHEWKPRTVYRDLHALERAGFPVTSEGSKWKLLEGWDKNLPFPLSLPERLSLVVARDLVRRLRGTPVASQFERLYDRLVGQGAPRSPEQADIFRKVQPPIGTPSVLGIDYSAHRAIIETICSGLEDYRTIEAVYFTASRNELTRRNIDPYHLHYDPQIEALYVFAYCHLRHDVRTFAVHRFRRTALTDQSFEPAPTFDPEAYLGGAFRMWRTGNTTIVRLGIDPEAASWVAERCWHSSQEVKRRADGGCELSFTVDGTTELKRFILQLGAAVEVLEPAWLRKEVADEHMRAFHRETGSAQESLTLDDIATRETEGKASG